MACTGIDIDICAHVLSMWRLRLSDCPTDVSGATPPHLLQRLGRMGRRRESASADILPAERGRGGE